MKTASNNVRTLGQIRHPCDNQQCSHEVATGSTSLMRWAGLAGSCFGTSWSVGGRPATVGLPTVVRLTGHLSGCLCVLGISLLTSDLLPKPCAQMTSCLLDIPLGSQSAWHLEFKASPSNVRCTSHTPPAPPSSLSRLSKWHPAAQAKKRQGGKL